MNNKKIPVIFITGYLGSGKTTLMQNLLKQEQRKIALIVNDMGRYSCTSGKLPDDITQKEEINMSDVKTECGIPGHCNCDGKDHSSCNV